MRTEALLIDVDELLAKLEEARVQLAADVAAGLSQGAQLRAAAREVGDSSSGSWVGWHSRMYYKDYSEPPVADSWDTEWGGIHGYAPEWQERSVTDVQTEIERRAGTTLAAVAGIADRVRETCEPLHAEVLTVLSPICDLAGLDRERGLLEEVEKGDWIISPAQFIDAIRPTTISSRDSHALHQGLQAPLHLNVEAAVASTTSTIAKGRDFLDQAIRLARQVRTKLEATPTRLQEASAQSPDARLMRQLRTRSIILFIVVAAVIAGSSVLLLDRVIGQRPVAAGVIVGAALLISAAYAILLDRTHALRALVIAAAIGGAIAALDQLLGHFYW